MTASFSDQAVATLAAKVRLRLVLPCALLLLLSTIDRTNVSFAAAMMNHSLGMNDAQYGVGAGIFFIGYILGQIPSILILQRIGFRRWVAGIGILWGVCAAGMAFLHSIPSFYTLRILLGFAEAGLAPGIMLYLSRWSDDRGRAFLIAIPLAAVPVSVAIAGPLSGLLLQMVNPLAIEGWRWMFLVEGLPTIVLALVALVYFPDKSGQAAWLSDGERAFVDAIDTEQGRSKPGSGARRGIFTNPRVWLCAALWFCLMAGNYGVIFWLPQMVRALVDLTPLEIGAVVALPWIANVLGILTVSRRSDRTGERFLHIALPSFVSALALLGAFACGATMLGFILLVVLGASLGCALGPYWAIPFRLLPLASRPLGTAVINVVGGLAGLAIPALFGIMRQATGSFLAPTILLVTIVALGGVVALLARRVDSIQRA